VRYTFEFECRPGGERITVRAITGRGEHMAAAMATARLMMLEPDVKFSNVVLTAFETVFEPDPENDAINYWEVA
jgi:hypothetical protein